jgi:hypothetical protein
MIYYRLKRGIYHPAFRNGELYRYIEDTYPPGYIYIELGGRPRCVWADHFEKVELENLTGCPLPRMF